MLAVAPAVIALLLGLLLLDGIRRGETSQRAASRAEDIIQRAGSTLSSLQDAETGQRGYLLTGEPRYLTPYYRAIPRIQRNLALLRVLTREDPAQQRRLDTLEILVADKLGELKETIALRRTAGLAAATAGMATDRGKRAMDAIGTVLAGVTAREQDAFERHQDDEASHAHLLLVLLLGGTIATIAVALLANRALLEFAAGETRQSELLAGQNTRLEEQALELELQASQLHEQAAELEATNDEMAQQSAQVAGILNATGDGILGVDTEGLTTFANPAAERMLGWTSAELVGKTQHDLIHHSHEDGSPYPATDCPLFGARRTGMVGHVDTEVFWRKDGTSLPVEYDMTPMLQDGVVHGAVVSFRDVTARRAQTAERERLLQAAESAHRSAESARQQLQTVFTQSPAAVVVTRGPQHQFELVNPLAARIAGRDVPWSVTSNSAPTAGFRTS